LRYEEVGVQVRSILLRGLIVRNVFLAACLVLIASCFALAAPDKAGPAFIGPATPPGIEGGQANPEPAPPPMNWGAAEAVFTCRVDSVVPGPVGMSYPPMYVITLNVTVDKVLRGTFKPGDKVACTHVVRQLEAPMYALGRPCLVALSKSQGDWRVERIEVVAADLLAQATLACAMPLGWRTEDGKPVSPWAALGKKAWPADAAAAPADGKVVCTKTGRPALLAGDAVTFDVAPVPPKVAIQWTNPDGDGEYTITIANNTDKPVVVPALLSSGGKILWEESLVILCQDKTYMCPGAKGVAAKAEPTTLAPHQSFSTTVNTLRLKGPEWPQGGYRIEFRFCLGEKSKTQSRYYM
jgi:hypothetical protein